jgi:phytoene/squalene synthetase
MHAIDWGKNNNESLGSAYTFCENIAKQKNPFLYYVTGFFEDKNKFKAFCSTYASMRILDDFVDGIKNRTKLNCDEKIFYLGEINKWEDMITDCYNGKRFENPILRALSDTFKTFNIQLSPWTKLAGAMRWDIEYSRFCTFKEFLNYTEGAAIAPATVFISVLAAQSDGNKYDCLVNAADPYIYAKDLAIFCYLTHILRDISVDLELEESGLIYLPVEDLHRFSISENDLWNFKSTKSINTNFQQLMEHQIQRARTFGEAGRASVYKLYNKLDSDCQFILNLLVSLYERTMDKIVKVEYNIFNGEHKLDNFEILRTTIYNARALSFGRFRTFLLGLEFIKKNYLKYSTHRHSFLEKDLKKYQVEKNTII